MLTNTKNLKGLTIHAIDGDMGEVNELFFDDETWAIRYLTVDTGGWLNGRTVLISPLSVVSVDWEARRIDVSLTKMQVENSPDVDTHRPVSRQHEAEYLGYYGYPYYWDGPALAPPSELALGSGLTGEAHAENVRRPSMDSHLRSTAVVAGYYLEATDGEIGHVEQFIVDDESWAIRYLEVDTTNWLPGKKVLLSPSWVKCVSWERSKVYVALTQEAIKSAPEYDESLQMTREYEDRLHRHYGRPPYWLNQAEEHPLMSLGGL